MGLILPQSVSVFFAPRIMKTSIAVTRIMARSTEPTCGMENLIRTLASTK